MALQIKRKTLRRAEWARIRDSAFAWADFRREGLRVTAGLLRMRRVREPLTVATCGAQTVIADDGFDWLQIAPEGQRWWLTVMFDAEGAIRQYYFDITRRNILAGADTCFEDLFLDVVAAPDGRVELLDEDELDAALAAGVITPAEAAIARDTADHLLADVPPVIARLADFCHRTRRALATTLP